MFRLCSLFAPLALLGACTTTPAPSPTPVARPLERAYIACRTPEHVNALHAAGANFQREADNHMADGRCRRFAAGQKVLSRGRDSFVDPANGVKYWIYHWS